MSDRSPTYSKTTAFHNRAAHYGSLVSASMVGCLIRLGLDALASYEGGSVFPLAWSQGIGCGIMGLSMELKEDLLELYPPIYTFLTTGLAGSVTTFSSWMLEGYIAFANSRRFSRNGLHNAVDGIAYTLITLSLSMASLHFGQHLARCVRTWSTTLHSRKTRLAESQPPPVSRQETFVPPRIQPSYLLLDSVMIVSAAISYAIVLIVFFYGPTDWRHPALLPTLLSPPGAILRYLFSEFNTRPKFLNRFPIGTFAVNIAGSLVIGGVYASQRLPRSLNNRSGCNALYGIQQGFCGCLTTVSTFAVELKAIKGARWTWVYGLTSVVFGHVAVLITFGAVGWVTPGGLGTVCEG